MNKGLNITQYAKQQGVDRSTVHRWINEGRLEYYLTPSKLKRITGVKEDLHEERSNVIR